MATQLMVKHITVWKDISVLPSDTLTKVYDKVAHVHALKECDFALFVSKADTGWYFLPKVATPLRDCGAVLEAGVRLGVCLRSHKEFGTALPSPSWQRPFATVNTGQE